ncbi:MAG: conserved hypothetical exported protein, partial [Bacteroidetes bacterium]|nr:conserved hypothetical exported protein [Bacteroidota bacterium]
MKKFFLLLILSGLSFVCFSQREPVILGTEQTKAYIPILKNKRVALFSNHTGMVGNKHTL